MGGILSAAVTRGGPIGLLGGYGVNDGWPGRCDPGLASRGREPPEGVSANLRGLTPPARQDQNRVRPGGLLVLLRRRQFLDLDLLDVQDALPLLLLFVLVRPVLLQR